MLDLSVIIVSWNVRDYLADCLRSIYAEFGRTNLRGDVWVVDNASTDGTQELLRDLFPYTRLLSNDDNSGFSVANNQGMQASISANGSGPKYFLFLNPDTLIRPGAIQSLVECMEKKPKAGMVGARLVYGDGRFQHSAFRFPGLGQLLFDLIPLPARLYDSRLNGRYPRRNYRPDGQPFSIDHPLGATMLVRRDVAEATGGFDESFHMYCEEIDWCWRIHNAGWTIFTVPKAEVVHFGGESTRQIPSRSVVDLWSSRAKLYRRHHGKLKLLLAKKIVLNSLGRRAKKSNDNELMQAYLEAAESWQAM
jgi:GT2 family glycosyltransferase